MKTRLLLRDRRIFSWALYDWANSAFATTVIAGFYPIFFKNYWASSLTSDQSTSALGFSNSTASLFLLMFAPLLGVLADQGGFRKLFLFSMTGIGVMACVALSFLGPDRWLLASFIYTTGLIGFFGANIFYDSLLTDVTEPRHFDLVSGFGYSMGYLGGGVLFALNVLMTLKPELFGFSGQAAAVQASFLTVALWWSAFSMPLFLTLPQIPRAAQGFRLLISRSILSLKSNIRFLCGDRALRLFFLGYLFYMDAVNTTIEMAVDYGLSLGLDSSGLIAALLLVQFVGFPAALFYGWLGEKIGTRQAILTGLMVYIGVCVFAYFMTTTREFFIMAILIGCVQGGVQSLSRSLFARMIPHGQTSEYFGFLNMIGKFSAVLGPALMGLLRLSTSDPRMSIFVILAFFVIGAGLLWRVPLSKMDPSY